MNPDLILNRRSFLTVLAAGAWYLSGIPFMRSRSVCAQSLPDGSAEGLHEVMFYRKLEDLKIECTVCPKKCRVADLERGYCGNKENRGGTYFSLVYGRACAVHVDPIEKKPLFHYLPGTTAYSLAAAGCNFECRFCQNWEIAQYRPEQVQSINLSPQTVVDQAASRGSLTIAYTYSEPVVFYEYMYDCARSGRTKGIGSIMISNGFINEEPLVRLCQYLTAVKIDLKAFTDSFYRTYCSGELEPVLHTLTVLKRIGIWFEIVVLIIPSLNDSPDEIRRMCRWIAEHLGCDIPLHFTRFRPLYKLTNLPPTPVKTLDACHRIATDAGLRYVYVGNVIGHPAESTYCPSCKRVVIKRMGYAILENNLKGGKCISCGFPIPGVWEPPGKL
ncbi:MAG: AmmeMemoRadiSam system radical SAM enzyme [Desulfobacterota bacterium]|nr:AmmeMemoRadiSam system radical SAM enzyme [Thermodesulfobacteriota bacterium]